jgi:hypothetical protein
MPIGRTTMRTPALPGPSRVHYRQLFKELVPQAMVD